MVVGETNESLEQQCMWQDRMIESMIFASTSSRITFGHFWVKMAIFSVLDVDNTFLHTHIIIMAGI